MFIIGFLLGAIVSFIVIAVKYQHLKDGFECVITKLHTVLVTCYWNPNINEIKQTIKEYWDDNKTKTAKTLSNNHIPR
uniref:Uncharacterized protein n=1 Tax=viral metagenome TaxID=1070528 RepID=A0A6M3K636_9ZZZZ